MKRALSVFLAICILPCLALAELSADDRAVMLDRTEALTALMAECAADDGYTKLYLGSNSEARNAIGKIASADWDEYRGGTIYLLKEGAIGAFLAASGVSLEDFSPAVAEKVRQSVAGSIPMAAVSSSGAAYTAAVSVLRTGTVFAADDDFPENAIVFLKYNADYGVLCSFVKGEDNAVSASLIPVPADSESKLKRVMGLTGLIVRHDRLYEAYPVH